MSVLFAPSLLEKEQRLDKAMLGSEMLFTAYRLFVWLMISHETVKLITLEHMVA